jgi:long-chain alkane monooxygenase
VVFAIQPHMSGMKTFLQQLQTAARDADAAVPKVTFGVQPIIGGTEAEAKRRLEELIDRIPLEASLARLSGSLGVDFSQMELDQPLEEQQTQASQGLMKAMSASFDNKRFTLREAAVRWGLAVGMPQLVGTPEQVADQLEAIWRETGCHGFNLTPTITPSSVEEFVDEVVPILQRRGIFRTAYAGETFRDNLLN